MMFALMQYKKSIESNLLCFYRIGEDTCSILRLSGPLKMQYAKVNGEKRSTVYFFKKLDYLRLLSRLSL